MDATPLFNAIATRLEPLSADLTGGIHRASEVAMIHFSSTPNAYDSNRELLPCLLINDNEARIPDSAIKGGRRAFFSLIFYERIGIDLIRSACHSAYELLNEWTPIISGWEVWPIEWAGDFPSTEGPMTKAPTAKTITSRYIVMWKGEQ